MVLRAKHQAASPNKKDIDKKQKKDVNLLSCLKAQKLRNEEFNKLQC
jgi:hypothetical protein